MLCMLSGYVIIKEAVADYRTSGPEEGPEEVP